VRIASVGLRYLLVQEHVITGVGGFMGWTAIIGTAESMPTIPTRMVEIMEFTPTRQCEKLAQPVVVRTIPAVVTSSRELDKADLESPLF
jgi:hypothetical protein